MNGGGSFSPTGLKVLLVDDDLCCLAVLEKMLRDCKYEVRSCNRASKALNLLRDKTQAFDLVISDVHMPDMDGFRLLELIGLEMDLPVIMMSANGDRDAVMRGIVYGACDYLVKPVRIEELRNIWQHVLRKRNEFVKDSSEDWDEFKDFHPTRKRKRGDSSSSSSSYEFSEEPLKNISNMKKTRLVWSFELHQKFVRAINRIGLEKAVPKRILEVMNIPGLTRENVASHLQKYRLYLKRLSGVKQEPFPVASFQAYGVVPGGTMHVQKPVPTSRSSTSVFQKGQFDAGTLASLSQLQAIQQAAHENGCRSEHSILVHHFPLQNTQPDCQVTGEVTSRLVPELRTDYDSILPTLTNLTELDGGGGNLFSSDVASSFVFPYHQH